MDCRQGRGFPAPTNVSVAFFIMNSYYQLDAFCREQNSVATAVNLLRQRKKKLKHQDREGKMLAPQEY
ncbi:hypothetical protein Cal7507_0981 [Calothrix sp. PCC 7507]|nr:hypothetical protein Cal7507_0981 [Calothrix sp. PCC 7507]